MNCRYDTRIPCTEQCKHINTCAWMKGQGRREKIHIVEKHEGQVSERFYEEIEGLTKMYKK